MSININKLREFKFNIRWDFFCFILYFHNYIPIFFYFVCILKLRILKCNNDIYICSILLLVILVT